MSALVLTALTALMAVAEAMGWARVEVLTPGETIRILFDSGQTEQRFFVGADSHTLFVLAPGFDRLTRSARRNVVDCLAHAPRAIQRIVDDAIIVQCETTVISREGLVRNGAAAAAFDDLFEPIDSRRVAEVDRLVRRGRRGAAIGAMIGIPHGLMALQGCPTSACPQAPAVVASAIALDAAIGYWLTKGEVVAPVYRR